MVKWIVGGKPRMALFAGDKPIMTGDELTYDYNFDPFSAKNVQECRCGSDNCRGVLGPRPKDQKVVKESIKEAVKAGVKAGKRKLKELLGGENEDSDEKTPSPKKRKTKDAKGIKRSTSSVNMKVAKDAAKAIKKSVSARVLNARQAATSRRVAKKVTKTSKTTKPRIVKTYCNRQTKLSSRNSSLTLVEGDKSPRNGARSGRKSMAKNVAKSMRGGRARTAPKATSGGTIRVVTGNED
jgi:histone-lysine N-methyltransferase ASH1L